MLKAAVIGAGLMGRRLALVFARSGARVSLFDKDPVVLREALASLRSQAEQPQGFPLDRELDVRAYSELSSAVSGADLVTEAIVENLALKQALFAELSELSERAILATNTSVLPITQIARHARLPERVIGTHWWNPPDLIPVVEVVRGARTSPEVMERTVAILADLGKLPVRVEKDVPGFVGNRLQHALWREAIAMVQEGICDAETVDLMARNTLGLRLGAMGPIENADYVGLDLTLAIHEAVLPSLDRAPHAAPLLRQKVADGQLGAKSGQGFLDWPSGARESARERLAAHLSQQLRTATKR
jgi:3-hydroxybutyryl-CoA dehydrogenase